MKLISVLFLASTLIAGAQTPISSLPVATILNTTDVVPIVQSGVTKQVTANLIAASVIANPNITSVFTNSVSYSNRWLTATTLNPTNVVAFTGTLHGTINTHTFTVTGGSFAGWVAGWNFVIGNDQYLVTTVINSTTVIVFQAITQNYNTSANISVYPNAVTFNDVNQTPVGFISNDGSVGVVGLFGPTIHNSGAYYLIDGTNSWAIQASSEVDGTRLNFGAQTNAGAQFSIYDSAPYDSMRIISNGYVSLKYGLVNDKTGPLNVYAPLNVASNTAIGGILTLTGTNTAVNAATISGSFGGYLLTSSVPTFSSVVAGNVIRITNSAYTITKVLSSTVVYVFDTLLVNYTNAPFSLEQPVETFNNQGAVQFGFIGSDGSFGLQQTPAGSRILFITPNSPSNTFNLTVGAIAVDGYRFSLGGIGGASFNVNSAAGYDSLRVLANGEVSSKYGITNFDTGILDLFGQVRIKSLVRLTNAQTTVIDFSSDISDVTTNANFAWVGFINKSTINYNSKTIYLKNTGGGTVNFTVPVNCYTNGTAVANCTNNTKIVFEYNPNGNWTNAIVTPIN